MKRSASIGLAACARQPRNRQHQRLAAVVHNNLIVNRFIIAELMRAYLLLSSSRLERVLDKKQWVMGEEVRLASGGALARM